MIVATICIDNSSGPKHCLLCTSASQPAAGHCHTLPLSCYCSADMSATYCHRPRQGCSVQYDVNMPAIGSMSDMGCCSPMTSSKCSENQTQVLQRGQSTHFRLAARSGSHALLGSGRGRIQVPPHLVCLPQIPELHNAIPGTCITSKPNGMLSRAFLTADYVNCCSLQMSWQLVLLNGTAGQA